MTTPRSSHYQSLARPLMGVVGSLLFAVLSTSVRADSDSSWNSPGPGGYRILSADSVISIPFNIYRGDIRMAAEVNGRPVNLLLDDGFMWDALLFWGGPAVDSLDLNYDGEIEVGGTSGENMLQSRTASGVTVKFPGLEFHDQTAVVTPSASGNSTMWSGSVGQISAAFFKHFVVDINFDEMLITLVLPGKFKYDGPGTEVPLKPLGDGPSAIPAVLTLADGRSVPVDLMLDLGYNDQLQIVTTGEHLIPMPDRTLPANLGMNIQGVPTMGAVGRMKEVSIGGHKLTDVIVAFISPEHSDHAFSEVMVGLGLLSRFNFVYDYPHQKMYFAPNRGFALPFEYNSTGLSLRKTPEGSLEVIEVYPESPASEAGLLTGDLVTQVEGRLVSEIPSDTLRSMLRTTNKTVRLLVQRGESFFEVSLTLRRVI